MSIDNDNYSRDNLDNGNYEVYKIDEAETLIDPNCKHTFKRDESDIIGDSVAWICSKCKRGTFIHKDAVII